MDALGMLARGPRVIILSIIAAALGPTFVAAGAGIYAQASLPTLNPEYVIAGVILVFMLSVFILRHEARRIFALVDAVPPLVNDVKEIKVDVGEIKIDLSGMIEKLEAYPTAIRISDHLKMGHDHGNVLATHELRLSKLEEAKKEFESRLLHFERERRA